ncbi:hypothetical protein RB195_005717 [Necator americanus]
MEKVTHDFYWDLFDSHVHLPPHHLREYRHVIPKLLPSEVRHTIVSVKNRTSPSLDSIKSEYLKYLPPVFFNTLARLFTRYSDLIDNLARLPCHHLNKDEHVIREVLIV